MEPKYVVLDLETSGFDPETDMILEVGALYIDMKTLEEKGRMHGLINPGSVTLARTRFDPVVKKMHTDNGLFSDMLTGSVAVFSTAEIETELTRWLREYVGATSRSVVLCGNSIHFDRGFIQKQMPYVFEMLSHRVIDTSSLRNCCQQWLGELAPMEVKAHRALEDCEMSLNTLRWVRSLFQGNLRLLSE